MTRAGAAAEPVAWWVSLLALYAGIVSTISPAEVLVGALASAVGAAAAVAARHALFTTGDGLRRATRRPARPLRRGRVAAWLGLALWLPAQVVLDTWQVLRPARDRSPGRWDRVPVRDEAQRRAVATLLLSAAPGSYVTAVEPDALTVHRLAGRASRLERRTRATGLLKPDRPGGPEREEAR